MSNVQSFWSHEASNILCVRAFEFDRVTAERDALQLLLNERDEQLGSTSQAARDIGSERQRQVNIEGWTQVHDDGQKSGGMTTAAGCYLLFSDDYPNAGQPPPMWPWAPNWWKPKDYRRDLVRAGALILAEIDRFDRSALATPPQ
ncbi:hypothetical protein POF45_26665 [Pseudomonas sp. 681]|uniref:Uncharacterized protein n=1 Tax=Pseudomonas fungipugnans TaxID=3024217 RepID=A0ABT6QVR8_9PSED|nr:hypothetical protein [Pseudomonas sp. 681]MDI2594979.1 hypothetical protein [Pseudomonas sp. 681]